MTLQGKKIIVIALVLFASAAQGEELSWQECVQQAAQGNQELRAAYQSQQATHYTAKAAGSNFYPQVSGTLGYTRGSGSPASASATAGSSVKDSYQAYISASQNLFNGFQDKAKVDQAIAEDMIQQAALATTRAKVSYDLKTAYAGLLYANRAVQLQQQIMKRREENLRLVQLRFESGRENKGSVLLSQAYMEQAKYDAMQANDSIAVQQSILAQVFGIGDSMEVSVTQDVPLEDLPANPDYYQLAQATPDHVQASAQQAAADAGVTIARSGFSPTVALNASTGRIGSEWFPDNDRWSVGATVSVPLFNGGRDYYGSKSALASLESASANLDNTDKSLISKLKQSWSNYLEARQKMKVDESFREAALKRAEIARSKYNNGLMTFEDWDLIENDLISREKTVLQSQRDLVSAEAAWQQAQGRGVIP